MAPISSPNTAPSGLQEYSSDPERSRLAASCRATLQGHTIGAIMRTSDGVAIPAMLAEIKFAAVTYCAAPNTDSETCKEGVAFVLSQFSHLNINEIREAFRLAASGKIDASLAAYHGQFSIRILGEVLRAYDDHRTGIYREERARFIEQQAALEAPTRSETLQAHFGTIAENFRALQEKNTKYPRWQDLPGWFCRRVIEDELIEIHPDEKGPTWIAAKHWAANQVGVWALDLTTGKEDRARYKAAAAVIREDADAFPGEIRKEAEEAYSKMLIFSKIAHYS